MTRTFKLQDIIGIVTMLALAVALILKLAPNHENKPVAQNPIVQKTIEKPLLQPVTLSAISLPAPPVIMEKPIVIEVQKVQTLLPTEKIVVPVKLTKLSPQKSIKVAAITPMKVREVKASTPKPAPEKTVSADVKNIETVKTGRGLLKFMEHGKGPAIEIIWPSHETGRARLYRHLTSCYGMVSAILAGENFYKNGQRGVWALNPDRFSGFLRQPTGALPREEESQLAMIQHQNKLGPAALPIRLFPRQTDAILLGGLQQLIGVDYLNSGHIKGRYELSGSGLKLIDIEVDGKSIQGAIAFRPVRRTCGESA